MPNGKDDGPIIMRRGNGEFTNVNDETERRIPLKTWWTCILVSAIDVVSMLLIGILAHRQWWNLVHPVRIYGNGWWTTVWRGLSTWWPLVLIAILLAAIGWSIPLFWRYFIETVVKNPPMYTPWESANGLWHPMINWRRRKIEQEGLRDTYRQRFGKNIL